MWRIRRMKKKGGYFSPFDDSGVKYFGNVGMNKRRDSESPTDNYKKFQNTIISSSITRDKQNS